MLLYGRIRAADGNVRMLLDPFLSHQTHVAGLVPSYARNTGSGGDAAVSRVFAAWNIWAFALVDSRRCDIWRGTYWDSLGTCKRRNAKIIIMRRIDKKT